MPYDLFLHVLLYSYVFLVFIMFVVCVYVCKLITKLVSIFVVYVFCFSGLRAPSAGVVLLLTLLIL